MLCFAVYFFKNSRFSGNYWTSDSHTNAVISRMLEYKQFKNMAFTGSNSYWCLSKSVENKLDEQTVRGTQRQFSEISVRKTKISCLPAPPRIFEHLKNGIITQF